MCAPRVIGAVKQEITRRQALGLLATPVVAGTLVRRAEARQAPVRLAGGFTRIHDLTHTLSPQTPVFPAFNPFQIVQRFEIASDGFFGNELTFAEHTGTHLDAPVHFAAGGLSTDQMDPQQFFAPLAVISIAGRGSDSMGVCQTVPLLR